MKARHAHDEEDLDVEMQQRRSNELQMRKCGILKKPTELALINLKHLDGRAARKSPVWQTLI